MAKTPEFNSSKLISEEEVALIARLDPFVDQLRVKIFRSLEEDQLWQPEDYVKYGYRDPRSEVEAFDSDLKYGFERLSDQEMFVFVGNMLTEAGLSNFTGYISSVQGLPLDENESNAFIRSVGAWSAEESRHDEWGGTMLERSERVDLRRFGISRQLFMQDGIDIRAKRSILKTFVYTSFQEQATRISHHSMARIFKEREMPYVVTKVMRMIGSDETLHGQFYALVIAEALKLDPNVTMEAIAYMLHTGITMPASQMRELGQEPGELFDHFSYAAQETGVYDFADYVKIWNVLFKIWKLEEIPDENLSELSLNYRSFIEKRMQTLNKAAGRRPNPIASDNAVLDGEYPWLVPSKAA